MAPEAAQDATETKPVMKQFTSKEVGIKPTKEKFFKEKIRKLSYYEEPEQEVSHALLKAVKSSKDGYHLSTVSQENKKTTIMVI